MKRWIWILIVVAVIVGGYFGWRGLQSRAVDAQILDLQTEAAARGLLTATVGATGRVRANQEAFLAFKTTGTVEMVNVEVGETVTRDTLLASLDRESISPQIILAEADLVAAEKALDDLLESELARAQAQKTLAQARDALDDAEYMWRVRQEGNRASGETIAASEANLVLAQQEVDRAQDAYSKFSGRDADDPQRALARSNLAAARQKRDSILRNLNWYTGYPTELEQAMLDADLALAEAQLLEAERAWDRVKDGPNPDDIIATEARIAAAKATLAQAEVRAPFNGIIAAVEIKPGDQAQPGQTAIHLLDLSRLVIDVDVSEVDINRIQVGQEVELRFDAVLDKTYHGEVVDVGLAGTYIQGVVNFTVSVELMDADAAIRPGLTAAVNIVVSQIDDVLLIPNRAVRVLDGQRIVYILQDGELKPVEITLGSSSDFYSEVVEGELKEGDLIVLNPPLVFDHNGPPPFVGAGS